MKQLQTGLVKLQKFSCILPVEDDISIAQMISNKKDCT